MTDKKWQYFSKLYHKWVDAKETDCKESLKKYGYEIRDYECAYENPDTRDNLPMKEDE